jgi:hypothetical protein
MSVTKNTGRQCVIGFKTDIVAGDIPTAGDYVVADLPQGAVITGGFVRTDVAFDTGETFTVTVKDDQGNTLDTLSGALGVADVGIDNLTPTGVKLTKPGEVVVTTAVNATAGSGFLYLEYIVDGRAEFSHG